jgi:hypothetical protein
LEQVTLSLLERLGLLLDQLFGFEAFISAVWFTKESTLR